MRVRVHSRAAVEDGAAEGADGVISVRPSAETDRSDLDLACSQAVLGDLSAILPLRFDDIGVPAFGPYVGPTMEDVASAIEFARSVRMRAPDGTLAVHCEIGVSRSAALALAAIADELGPGREGDAVAWLLRDDADGRFQPNSLIVSLADAALFRYGAIDAALAEACPRYVRWRQHWQEVSLDPEAHWRRIGKVKRKVR